MPRTDNPSRFDPARVDGAFGSWIKSPTGLIKCGNTRTTGKKKSEQRGFKLIM
jgi:hypothetical protein